MLKRVSNTALRLPGKFSERTIGGLVIAYGETVDDFTTIHVHQKFPSKKHKPAHLTSVDLSRDTANGTLLDVEAERVIVDETDTMRIQRFALGAEENNLSLFRVMRTVGLAVQTVETAALMDYYAEHPEAISLGQTL